MPFGFATLPALITHLAVGPNRHTTTRRAAMAPRKHGSSVTLNYPTLSFVWPRVKKNFASLRLFFHPSQTPVPAAFAYIYTHQGSSRSVGPTWPVGAQAFCPSCRPRRRWTPGGNHCKAFVRKDIHVRVLKEDLLRAFCPAALAACLTTAAEGNRKGIAPIGPVARWRMVRACCPERPAPGLAEAVGPGRLRQAA